MMVYKAYGYTMDLFRPAQQQDDAEMRLARTDTTQTSAVLHTIAITENGPFQRCSLGAD